METLKVDSITNDFLQNLLKGNRSNCSLIAHNYLKKNPSIKDLYEEVFKVSLYEVGRLWETNQITVATEHMATAITEGILNELFEQITPKKKFNKRVVVACVENEQHQVGIKMVADVFEMKGWESLFLGAGIPTAELIRFIRESKPDVLAISLSIYFNFTNLIKMLELVRSDFSGLQIIVGGQAFSRVSNDAMQKLGNVVLLPDLYLLEKYIETLNT
ncbi:MAG: cobalamin B12-binding domain-containing protein [Bacteroidetes bacterium]|nr:MAG: cobalamin B12-binding domain-containing protein [Bacteroidota bacterium]